MGTPGFANSSRARCAILSRDTGIRICSVPRLTRKKPLVKMSSLDKVMGLAEYFCRPLLVWISKYGHTLGKTLCSCPRRQPGRQGHWSTGLAPRHNVRCPWDFLGLINTSRTSLVRNNERYLAFSPAVSEAFLEDTRSCTQFLLLHLLNACDMPSS
jgi:hypothetical protein